MHVVCLDLEGVLVPEIWIEFAIVSGIEELKITTRDEPDYNKLMNYRIQILDKHKLKLADVQRVISLISPLPGAETFASAIRSKTQLIILSDTFTQFALPLMAKLNYPTIFCNELIVDSEGVIKGYTLRQTEGKRKVVKALKGINFKVFAAGDSYNDLGMLSEADKGVLFKSPSRIRLENPQIQSCDDYSELLQMIENFII